MLLRKQSWQSREDTVEEHRSRTVRTEETEKNRNREK